MIGGDAAGMSAASNARRLRGPDALEILAFEKGRFTSYSACGIPYLVGGTVLDADALIRRWPDEFRDRQSIDVRTRHLVEEIDLGARRVRVRDLDSNGERWEGFDLLMIGTGARPVRPPLPGVDARGIVGVQHHEHGLSLLAVIEERQPRRAVIVGGGYIGLEMAEALRDRGISVSLVEGLEQPMGTLDPDMGALVADALRASEVELYLGEPVDGFDVGDDGWVAAVRTATTTLPADLVILGLGVRPETALAEAAGIRLGETKGIATDDRMRTSVDGVWAAGDCVETTHRVTGRRVSIALGTHANKQGRVAGIDIGGGHARFPGVIGTAIVKICGTEAGRTGLTEKEAAAAGLDAFPLSFRSTVRSGYMPPKEWMTTKIVVEGRTGRLLGAQIVGAGGAAKRIDTFAACIWNGMTVHDIQHMDLSYAPPFSPVWDAVVLAGRKGAEQARTRGERDGVASP